MTWRINGKPIEVDEAKIARVLEVIEGPAEIWLANEKSIVKANQSVLIPAGAKHGFRNLETTILHVRATIAASIFEASYEDRNELSRRWSPDFRTA